MDYKVRLRPSEVKDFVAAAMRSDCHIDIASSTNRVVDAKSILGVLGLDLSGVLTVSVYGYDRDFEQYLKRFSMAC